MEAMSETVKCSVCQEPIELVYDTKKWKGGKIVKISDTGQFFNNDSFFFDMNGFIGINVGDQSYSFKSCYVHIKCFQEFNRGLTSKIKDLCHTADRLNHDVHNIKNRAEEKQDLSSWIISTLLKTLELKDLGVYEEMSYEEFLKTDYWKLIRILKLAQKNACQVCGSKDKLNVHHTDYENKGQELFNLNDLVVLCEVHHKSVHRIK